MNAHAAWICCVTVLKWEKMCAKGNRLGGASVV